MGREIGAIYLFEFLLRVDRDRDQKKRPLGLGFRVNTINYGFIFFNISKKIPQNI